MTYLQISNPPKLKSTRFAGLAGPLVVIASFLAAYAPTFKALFEGPWQTEQEGHGPLIIAAAIWLAWQSRERLTATPIAPAPIAGWALLLFGLFGMFLARTQGVLTFEAFSAVPLIAACVLVLAGWSVLRVLAFPILFLLFAVPVPDWAIDA